MNGAFGKWHLGTLTAQRRDGKRARAGLYDLYSPPDKHHFDEYVVSERAVPTFCPMRRWGSQATFVDGEDDPNFRGERYWQPPLSSVSLEAAVMNISEVPCEDTSMFLVNQAIDFMRTALQRPKPFFLYLPLHSPHRRIVDPADPFNEGPYNETRAYMGSIRDLDSAMCELRSFLEDSNEWDNTIFMFFSDNGPKIAAGGRTGGLRGSKGDLYEGGVRVPTIVSWPARISPGSTSSFPASTSDLLPSLAALLCGRTFSNPKKEMVDGLDVSGILFGNEVIRRTHPIFFWHDNMATVVTTEFKLVAKRTKKRKNAPVRYELYSLLDDRGETNDIFSSPPALLDVPRMIQDLSMFQVAVGAHKAFDISIMPDATKATHGYIGCDAAQNKQQCRLYRLQCRWQSDRNPKCQYRH